MHDLAPAVMTIAIDGACDIEFRIAGETIEAESAMTSDADQQGLADASTVACAVRIAHCWLQDRTIRIR